jgi:hypothetical protein
MECPNDREERREGDRELVRLGQNWNRVLGSELSATETTIPRLMGQRAIKMR